MFLAACLPVSYAFGLIVGHARCSSVRADGGYHWRRCGSQTARGPADPTLAQDQRPELPRLDGFSRGSFRGQMNNVTEACTWLGARGRLRQTLVGVGRGGAHVLSMCNAHQWDILNALIPWFGGVGTYVLTVYSCQPVVQRRTSIRHPHLPADDGGTPEEDGALLGCGGRRCAICRAD